jgi:hypothetical protein
MDGEATKKQQQRAQQRESEEAEQQESVLVNNDNEERLIDILAKRIVESKDHRSREEEILNFLAEWLHTTICNMEYSSRRKRRKARKNEEERCENLVEALNILEEHYKTMKYVMSKAAEYEEMEMKEEMSVGEDEYEEYNAEHDDDDDMEVDFMSDEVRKSGGGKE